VIPVLLTIAGTDPSGAAGLQADLQVFRDFGFHGASVVTAVLAQNTGGVRAVRPLVRADVEAQLAAVFEDLDVAAIKVGLTASESIAQLVMIGRDVPQVWDPVLWSGDGVTVLAGDDVVAAIVRALPHVDVLTPNAPEASRLTGRTVENLDDALGAAARLVELGAGAVLLKCGHLSRGLETIRDVWADADGPRLMKPLPAIEADARGTGCQLSSAIAAELARGKLPLEAAESAREYLSDLLWFKRRKLGRGRDVVVRT